MAYYEFVWTDEIIDHLAEHGITPQAFEELVNFPKPVDSVDPADARAAGA